MRTLKQLGHRLVPVLIFVAGVVAGVAMSGVWIAAQMTGFVEEGPGALARNGTELVMLQLGLDEGQKAELAPVFARVEEAFVVMHRKNLTEVRVLFEEVAREIRPRLRPEQREILDEMMIAPRRRWEKFLGAPLTPISAPKEAESNPPTE